MANAYSTTLASASSQYFNRNTDTGLALTGDFTIEGWFNFATLPSSGNLMWLMDKKSEAGEDYSIYSFWLNNNAGTYQLTLRTTNGTTTSLIDKFVTWTPSTATWYHLAVTRASSGGAIKFYVDGSQQGTDQTGYNGALSGTTNLQFYVGRYKSADGRYFNGSINDLRLWNAVRTVSEISTNKANCSLSDGTSGLVGRWFNAANDANDQTAGGHNLTNNNSATFTSTVAYSCVGITPRVSFIM